MADLGMSKSFGFKLACETEIKPKNVLTALPCYVYGANITCHACALASLKRLMAQFFSSGDPRPDVSAVWCYLLLVPNPQRAWQQWVCNSCRCAGGDGGCAVARGWRHRLQILHRTHLRCVGLPAWPAACPQSIACSLLPAV
eukprot:scaffold260840_cov15-Prasinocladus_malaysianus.AAC.1